MDGPTPFTPRISRLAPILVWALFVFSGWALAFCEADTPALVRRERIEGSLIEAETLARRAINCPELTPRVAIELRIELARILDRVGLHQNTRPVQAALEMLEDAEHFVNANDLGARAMLDLALADYYYRSEAGDKQYPLTLEHARKALTAFADLEDPVGCTDATHRIAMVAFQRRELDQARAGLKASLELSKRAPERPIFLGDYHRHYALVLMFSGDPEAAIPHLEASLDYRQKAKSPDYSFFAFNLLGATLVDVGRAAEARPQLEQARRIAEQLPSPIGQMRNAFYRGEMYTALGEEVSAVDAYGMALKLAEDRGVESFRKASNEALERLQQDSEEGAASTVPPVW